MYTVPATVSAKYGTTPLSQLILQGYGGEFFFPAHRRSRSSVVRKSSDMRSTVTAAPRTSRRNFLGLMAPAVLASAAKPNVLLITADDLNWDSPGCFGGRVHNLTPNIDLLAKEGIRFARAHVNVAVCQPSRSALMTGRYPHRNGAQGFGPVRNDVPTLQESLRRGGYLNGILAKTDHLEPAQKFCWDYAVPAKELGDGRVPSLYYRHTKAFLEVARKKNKPFFLMANAEDPHRPFAGSEIELKTFSKHYDFTRQIRPEEVPIPGFLPDLPNIRRELAQYFTSVHRCDQTVGAILRALSDARFEQDTVVMFLSDNGMALPYAKTNCYLASTRTPWIVRWPGRIKRDAVEQKHFISGIDFTPTVLDITGLPPIEGVDGRSFLSLLEGRPQPGRSRAFTVFHETFARERFEMRCVQEARFGYIYNDWADGTRTFRNESQLGLTWPAMVEGSAADAQLASRVRFYSYRTREELYDFQKDPSGVHNLAGQKAFTGELRRLRGELAAHLRTVQDPLLDSFLQRTNV
jgi:N-sulfoglucosamine sulfohydrolase